ncbi:uncharacterized protein DS421_5g159130 [Arachis hypogaea]|uniref:Uncharacterized protein n=1 Tax=Arachis hypogaea TaxID=3818 RepID=A0A445D2I0_ARAHY|nr:uncharacterized protein DS421_5g159130 [Arachis hypogaea]RYR57406.1 hypothetical protein Ahy_A05g023136 [Arachis hypogaea]
MKATSKMIMGATLVTVLSLAIVLALILVLLAELYCSLLLRRRHPRTNTTTTTTTPAASYPTLKNNNNNVYAQGVFQPPRSFLFPSLVCMAEEPNPNANESTPHSIGLVSVPSPLASFINRAPPTPKKLQQEVEQHPPPPPHHHHHHECSNVNGEPEQHLVYISNPIYENQEEEKEEGKVMMTTPFETPETSPSQLDDYDDDDVDLSRMKKLPEEASSLRVTFSASDQSHSNNNCLSSSSASPSTSPSW